MSEKIYDTVIIGGGPAGYTAALYAVRAGLSTLIVERLAAGGQMCETMEIDNYPGVSHIDGYSLGATMKAQAEQFGAVTLSGEVTKVTLTATPKQITVDGATILARTVILATGATHRHLGLPREEELIGRGVAYCATCDGMFYRGKHVVVVGGGNSAVADALFLSGICKQVTLVHRRDTLRASPVYLSPLQSKQNVMVLFNSEVKEFLGEERLSGVRIHQNKENKDTTLTCDGVFISVGRQPITRLFEGQVPLDQTGYIVAGEDTQTPLPGVFAAGDVRTKPLRQIVTACADGAVAAEAAAAYLAGLR